MNPRVQGTLCGRQYGELFILVLVVVVGIE